MYASNSNLPSPSKHRMIPTLSTIGLLRVAIRLSPGANLVCWHLLLVPLVSRDRVGAAYARSRNTANRIASVVVGVLGLGLLVASLREARTGA